MRKKVIWGLAVLLLLLVGYPGWIAYRVWDQANADEVHSADAIVVLGAAQYDGDPSPVFQARLDHAAYLYDTGVSRTIIVTGGKARGDRFSEAEAGERYLVDERGVDPDNILSEIEGTTTFESLEAVWEIAEPRDMTSILLVSDPMHSERIKMIATDLGFEETYASRVSYQQLDRSRETKAKELVREVVSIIHYQLFGG
jgi:vancomycin permeability regulator SanA